MGRKIVAFTVALGLGAFAAFAATGAFAHQSGCHAAHSCPSDHHTYVWFDASGQGWDCAAPGAPEYDPALDTTPISQGGLAWYCRAAGTAPPTTPATTTTAPPPPTTITTPPDTGQTTPDCVYRNHRDLPDPSCTPGASLPSATVARICRPGYLKRAPNVEQSLKDDVYAEYAIASPQRGEYEIDHLIPLALGGAESIDNLWPEPANNPNSHGFRVKDRLENRLHARVCSRRMTLRAAQRAIQTNWVLAYKRFATQP
jgi:hypothetical protein